MKQNVLTKSCWVLFFIFSLFTSPLQAQYFEWAKGFASGQEGNRIIGSVTDSVGNLYILGLFSIDAAWDGGSHLLPMAPYGSGFNTGNALIAKITPDGEMAWKKVIHANGNRNPYIYDIKPVGDTAFACLIDIPLPNETYNYLYYLDTLLTASGDYPTPNGNMSYMTRTAFITFDFEGHVLEQHFLTITYLDNDGNDLMRHYDPPITPSDWYINATGNYQSTFDIDADGNVYFCRIANDFIDQTYATWLGTIGGIKYWVDGRVVGQVEVRNSPLGWYPQLLKFSPHMDTLLASRYLVQRCDTNIDYQIDNLYLKIDHEGNPYVIGTLDQSFEIENMVVFDSIKNISLYISPANVTKGYLVKFDNDLMVIHSISLEDSVINPQKHHSFVSFLDIAFDNDSNYVFLTASTSRGSLQDTSVFYSILLCQNTPLFRLRNDGFIMVFHTEQDTLKFISYFHPSGQMGSSYNKRYVSRGTFVCEKNRIITQAFYTGGVLNIPFSNWYDVGLGLAIFDYQGHILREISYSAISPNNCPGPISIFDSILYLSNCLVSDASFGDIHVPAQGSIACVAKYIDTAFLTPYLYVPDTDSVRLVKVENSILLVYPVPVQEEIFLSVGNEQVIGVNLSTLTGVRKSLPFSNGRASLVGLPSGIYILEVNTNQNKYHKKIIVL